MSRKRILILRACGIAGEKQECDNIKSQCELYDIEVHDYCPKSNQEIDKILYSGITFDYVYLSSHGNREGFGSEDGEIDYNWLDFGTELCSSGCLEEDCIIFLSCCRGGLNEVAYSLFYCCTNVSYVVGARQSLAPHDMLISFNILLYNVQHRSVDPIVACEKIKLATDIRFVCFDQMETMSDLGFSSFVQNLDAKEIEQVLNAKEKEKERIN
ncbi:hypothetical protein J2X69_000417 [Algoriphagus sp. 4150]|uniref:hypothetical protein n=1 Tax=Algoriphagus sp. 4150 TaxID=2817756 RepID=UPI00286488B4|nr:hypothetical protein [Algoriphagus sp. 4150]MDR7128089.1 hypothetical protein [Algoriphagus sp. 4150]